MLSIISWVKVSEILNVDEKCFRWQIIRCWKSRTLWWRTNWRPSERVYRHDIIETCTSMIIGKVYLFWWDPQDCVWMCHFKNLYMHYYRERYNKKDSGVFDACFFVFIGGSLRSCRSMKEKEEVCVTIVLPSFSKEFYNTIQKFMILTC